MKTIMFLLSILFLGCSTHQQSTGRVDPEEHTEVNKVKLTHFRGPIFISEDSFYEGENSLVYVGKSYVTVIGATWTPHTAQLLVNEIRKITDKPIKEVVNTNWHHDRAGGNAFFKGIGSQIYATQKTVHFMKLGWDAMTRIKRKDWATFPDLPLMIPDQIQAGDFALQEGRIKAFYLGPSHTEDGLFVYFPAEKTLYGGCILKEKLGYLGSSNIAEYPKTLQKLKDLKLDIDTIISGHWSPIHGPELIDQYLALLAKNAGKSTSQ
jgi:metallo-beta-lactamase class B